ncbi:hypothetical protein PN437_19880 [Microcystis aeruginosa CS-564/01]|uniref:hypothetical protein n=1 Tax=Microcystis aeruginosa TaxID=1126 RepID=UPI002330ED57|nr:hypothetical protein [Microcystis aeruginosa]MDB9427125.1 hypothetical protein [Microcystis aeruginosa CS-564/01]
MKINVGFAPITALVMGAVLRRLAFNALNQESTYRRSLAQKSSNSHFETILRCFSDLEIR